MDVRQGDESFITNKKNMEKSSIFSSRIITKTNKMTNFMTFFRKILVPKRFTLLYDEFHIKIIDQSFLNSQGDATK